MTAENRLDTMVPWSVWLSSSSATSRRFFSLRSASVFSCVSFSSRERKPSTCAGGHLSLPTVAWRVLERVQRVCASLFFVNVKDSPPSMLSSPAVWRHNRLSARQSFRLYTVPANNEVFIQHSSFFRKSDSDREVQRRNASQPVLAVMRR